MNKLYGKNCEFKNEKEAKNKLIELVEKNQQIKKEMHDAEKKAKEYENKALELYYIHVDYVKEINRMHKKYNLDVDL